MKQQSNNGQPQSSQLIFKKSSLCSNGECVEVAFDSNDQSVVVRDNKNLLDKPLSFSANEWDAFIAGVKNGEFDFFK